MNGSATMADERGMEQPTLSVIIPSFNRCASVKRAVLSLYEQDYPLKLVEVIVVLDGGNDGSAAMLAELRPPFHLFVVEQDNQGSAAARNHGAARAGGEVLVFIDDDMEAGRYFLAEHARSHTCSTDRVIIGYFGSNLDGGPSYSADQMRSCWAAMFQRMRSSGHRYAYTDLRSGNFSLRKELFQRVGGFNEALRCREDYELGYRLLAAGAEFFFVEAASCVHHECCDLRRALRRKVAEGRNDVQLGRLHPSLKSVLPMHRSWETLALPSRIMKCLAFGFPVLGDRLARVCERALGLLERTGRYDTWLRVLAGLNIYWYWRGVARELPSMQTLSEFLSTADHEPERPPDLIVQLNEGVAAATARMDYARPAAATLFYGDRLIGRIPSLSGAERLRGRHLRPLLWDQFRAPLRDALTEQGAVGVSPLDEHFARLPAQSNPRTQRIANGARGCAVNGAGRA